MIEPGLNPCHMVEPFSWTTEHRVKTVCMHWACKLYIHLMFNLTGIQWYTNKVKGAQWWVKVGEKKGKKNQCPRLHQNMVLWTIEGPNPLLWSSYLKTAGLLSYSSMLKVCTCPPSEHWIRPPPSAHIFTNKQKITWKSCISYNINWSIN